MTSTYTANIGAEKPATGDRSGTWGTMTNTNMDIIDRAIAGVGAITLSGTTHTLTTTDGSLTDGMYRVLVLGGSPSGTNTITISPNDQDKLYFVVNSSGQIATFTQGSGANVSIPNGGSDIIYADGAGSGAAVASVLSKTLTTGNIIIPDAGNIGSASDTDAIAVSSAGVVALSATTEASATTTAALTVAGGLGVAKDVWIGDDLVLDSDATVISLGADQDVTVTHVADSGVTLKNTSTGDDTPFVLLIQTGEENIAINDVLGKIQFQAPDEETTGDSRLVAAEIAAISEGDFSDASNATKLSFKTGASEAATEKMSLSSGGNLTVSGTYNGGGLMTTGGNVVIPDAGNIGSASDTDAIAISSAGLVTCSGALTVTGVTTLNGNITLGSDASDNITVNGDFVSTLTPNVNSGVALGSSSLRWSDLYVNDVFLGSSHDSTGILYIGTTSAIMSAASKVQLLFTGVGSRYGISMRPNSAGHTYYMNFGNASATFVGGISLDADNAGVTFAESSDYRLKENITDLTGAIDRVKALKPRRFSFKIDENKTIKDGFLAHEAAEVVPEAVTGEKDAMKDGEIAPQSIDRSRMIPLLTGALQEAIAKIEVLESKVAALEAS